MTDVSRTLRDPAVTAAFLEDLFGHDLLDGHKLGVSRFGPSKKAHTFHATPGAAAAWAVEQAEHGDVYFRTTPVRVTPEKGKRGDAALSSAIVGVHSDTDIADAVHKKGNLPPDEESARRVISAVGLEPTLVVHSGHGLQAHWLLKEPWVFVSIEDHLRATAFAAAFQRTIAAKARAVGGWDHDNVGDLARIMRLPGTLNRKQSPVPVRLLVSEGPRYTLEDIEGILVIETADAARPGPTLPRPKLATSEIGFDGDDEELLDKARHAQNGRAFTALFDNGDTLAYGGDHSKADWHLCDNLAFWVGPDAARIDRLFRRSKLFRAKWDAVHGTGGRTYGGMTIADVLSRRKAFLCGPSGLPRIVVNVRQLRDETDEAVDALRALNARPVLFQRGSDLVRVRLSTTVDRPVVQLVGPDHIIEMLTRAADFVQPCGDKWVNVRPPLPLARNILARPSWEFPVLKGVVAAPRIRPDGSVLLDAGYDAATQLVLHPVVDLSAMVVPEHPTDEEVRAAVDAIDDVLQDFLFVDMASRANFFAFMLTPILRPAIAGAVPVCAFDALSKQGTGKSLLLRTGMIIATGREPAMSAVPADEAEFAKSLTSVLLEGREVVAFDNASGTIESGVWANTITSPVFDNRILGLSKNAQLPVRCTWAITGNSLSFGPDLGRRCYLVMQDARVERPDERTDFKYELPAYAIANQAFLQRAALTICRSWWSNGCPPSSTGPMGSFEDWTRVVGGVLENAGIVGFLDNRREFRQSAETERGEWHGLIDALGRAFANGKPFTAADVVAGVEHIEWLKGALPPRLADALEKRASFATRLGRSLREKAGAVFGHWRLEALGPDSHTKRPRYRVIQADSSTQFAGVAGDCGASPIPPTCGRTDIPV